MKHSQFILGLIIVTLIGCTNLIDENQPEPLLEPMVFIADVEVPADNLVSKTLLGGDVSDAYRTILWEQGDEVYVSNGDHSSKFVSVTREKSSSTQLEGELSSGSLYYAAYPYDLVESFKSSTFNIKLSSVQTYFKDGVSPGAFPMVAYSADRDLKFKNICGLFVFQLTGKHSITSISFSGKDQDANEVTVAGIASVSMDYSDAPSIDLTNSSETEITLICDDPVQLLPGESTSFHFVLPEGTFSSFRLLITADDGSTMIVDSEKTLSIKRSIRTTASPLEYIPYSIDTSNSVDLSANDHTANCYIVSEPGVYKFDAVKGNYNSSDYNGLLWDVESVDVLWESFGTDITPRKGDLIRAVSCDGGSVHFATNELFQEGNALIAARDKDGDILWSWHIWFTDKPIDQIYPSGAGSMMDRNLGATDNAVGEVGSLGLMYQWGRKDPFLGSSSIAETVKAKSTITWPESTSLNLSTGVMEYSIEHPTTFIQGNYDFNDDWCDSYDAEVRWTTTAHKKSIYDPCPAGYRVPDGGIWSNARLDNLSYNNEFKGLNLFENVWYPAAGNLYNGTVTSLGIGRYWTASCSNDSRYPHYISHLYIRETGGILLDAVTYKSLGASVRCFKEYSDVNLPVVSDAEDLNNDGESANSYIVSKVGTYKFDAVKGNSNESVGEVVSAEVLWKSFGTDAVPNYKDLVSSVSYSEGEVYFTTSEQFQEGNVLVAVKDVDDVILWSWHIWLTDQPGECTYANNAGVLMDRNLGAISNTRGSVGAIGLQYQWGRKDPFLGPCSLYDNTMATSTGTWSRVHVNSSVSVDWTIMNPMVYITTTDTHWNYQDVTLWDDEKTIYDPCPSGWRVPDGGPNGVWVSSGVPECEYDDINMGITIPEPYSVPQSWYPRTLARNGIGASLSYAGYGAYWGCNGSAFMFNSAGLFKLSASENKTVSMAVRCIQED